MSLNANNEVIYSQPQLFVLWAAWKATGLNLALLLNLFMVLCAAICFRFCIGIYDFVLNFEHKLRPMGILLFCWGGGSLAFCGGLLHGLLGLVKYDGMWWDKLFRLDPGHGWWCLNLGRALIHPMEAYYHALFLAAVLCFLLKKWKWVIVITFILCWSHPFTGIEWLCIILTYTTLDVFYFKNPNIPKWLWCALFTLFMLHIGYYLGYLNLYEGHRSVAKNFAQDWQLYIWQFVPAYSIVTILLLWLWRKPSLFINYFKNPTHRFFVVWAFVAFALANHEFAFKPIQPIHFTRGYIWTGLFLAALPTLGHILLYIQQAVKTKYKFIFVAFVLFFLSDNLLWFYTQSQFYFK
jgi:hypothetical protein